MALPANRKKPSRKQIGCRIKVRLENANEAAKLFERNGFIPTSLDKHEAGYVSFWFGTVPDEELYRIFTCIPREFYALQGVLHGDHRPFSPKPDNGG